MPIGAVTSTSPSRVMRMLRFFTLFLVTFLVIYYIRLRQPGIGKRNKT